MSAAIAVRGLRMRYGSVRAVDDISFEVHRGEIFALLGPNGAGKTTTVEILEGHRRRTGGTVSVLGVDPEHGGRRYRERIGIMLQGCGVDGVLTVADTVRLYASFYATPRDVAETIEMVGLSAHARTRAAALSGGLERRMDLALALVGDPEVVFLDEPTTGFDPSARRAAWEMLAGLRQLGKTVLLTSHYMDEVEHLADRVMLLRRGRTVAESTPRHLGDRDVAETAISFAVAGSAGRVDLPAGPWRRLPGDRDGTDRTADTDGTADSDLVVLHTTEPTRALAVLTGWATERGEELVELSVSRPSLEETYLRLTDPPDTADVSR